MEGPTIPKVPDILHFRMPYAYVLLAFLLVLNFFTASQAIFLEQEWVSVGTNTLLFILTVLAFVCIVAVDMRSSAKGPKLQETGRSFGFTFVIGASWFFIFLATINPPVDALENLLMTIYFTKAAAIEELVFRYAFPRLLAFEGYSYWVSQLVSQGIFSLAHFFVWEYSILSAIVGIAFGFLQMLAFTYGQSFFGIVWGHALHNMALAGANWWFMALATGIILVVMVARKWK